MTQKSGWIVLMRIALKTAVLFALCNLLFAVVYPLDVIGHLSLYNHVLPGRDRLPYGENPSQSYNVSLDTLSAMFASHVIARPKAPDEFRVVLIGDSSVWGWLLENQDTLSARLNAAGLATVDNRRVVFYNLGYPIMALFKDLLLLDEAMSYQPDMMVWLVTLESFPLEKQLFPPLVQHNAPRVRQLIADYDLSLDSNDPRLVDPDFMERTLVGQRRALADLLRLQTYGLSWSATGIDQVIPTDYTLRTSDFKPDISWQDFAEPVALTTDDLAFDVLAAGAARVGDIPLLLVNEPIFISTGENSDLRYNSWYPRWAYDAYRGLLAETAANNSWPYLDTWDAIAPDTFTDSPVHLTPDGTNQLADLLILEIERHITMKETRRDG